jgi:hypothetical protein
MWRAVMVGTLSCVCMMRAAGAEDACVSIPNGIICGQIVPNPDLVIKPPPPPQEDRRDKMPPGNRLEDSPN